MSSSLSGNTAASRPGAKAPAAQGAVDHDVLLYDGVCALCNGVVRFLVARDRERRFRYAPLQSEFAREALARHGEDAAQLSTVFLIQSFGRPQQRLLRRSRAVLAAMRRLGGRWGLVSRVLGVLPTAVLDLGYRAVARARYATFGRYDSCPLPAAKDRDLFIDSPITR
jgi:predicted DCC family thiol-disulfide oxidoreductase YuxK